MKHIFYKPKEKVNQPIILYPIQDNENVKNITIFHNIIATHTGFLTLDEFTNSFNDASQLDYLEPEYKERVAKAYWQNQEEYPNEDLMYFDSNFSYLDKILIAKYSKNAKMFELISTDLNPLIRQELAKRKYLPQHIINKLAKDSDKGVRLNIVPRPLTKEQIKLYAKESDFVVIDNLFANHQNMFDDELVEYCVKNGSDEIKSFLTSSNVSQFLKNTLTNEQIDYLAQFKSCLLTKADLETKANLLSNYKLSEKTLNYLLDSWNLTLMGEAARYRSDLTKSMIDKMIERDNNILYRALLKNNELRLKSFTVYEYAVQQILKRGDTEFLIEALDYYVRKQEIIDIKLPIEILEHFVNVNHKKGNLKLANLILHIKDVPQFLAERIAFDSLNNYKFVKSFARNKKYYRLGKDTPFSAFIQQIRNYTTSLKSSSPASHLLSRLW